MSDLVKRLGMLAHHLHSLDSESGEGKLLTDAKAHIEALEAPHTDRNTPCPKCGFVVKQMERKPIGVVDEGGEGE